MFTLSAQPAISPVLSPPVPLVRWPGIQVTLGVGEQANMFASRSESGKQVREQRAASSEQNAGWAHVNMRWPPYYQGVNNSVMNSLVRGSTLQAIS